MIAKKEYKPGIFYRQTPEQKHNKQQSWLRDDTAFFAAGACHILAFAFKHMHKDEHWDVVYLCPKNNASGNHVYVTDGTWAFDYSGWTRESELLRATEIAYRKENSTWDYQRIVLKESLEEFCRANNHRLPSQYFTDPWARTYQYLLKFSPQPPQSNG